MSERGLGRAAATTRMFQSDLLERFSRIHPATPFIAWLPVVGAVLIRARVHHRLSASAIAISFALGAFVWTLTEYLLHRYVFHWVRDSSFAKRVHFILHGVHHEYPNDKDRLVMPLGASIPLAIAFYSLFHIVIGKTLCDPFFGGFVIGYLIYDGTHYAIHHFRQTTKVGKWLKRHHMMHHYADNHGGFGVSSPLWDIVFRTMPIRRVRDAEDEKAVREASLERVT